VDIELRPMRLAEILDRIFQLYRARLVLFMGIAAISTLIELVWNVFNMGITRWMGSHHVTVTSRQWVTGASTIPGWIFVFAGAALCLAASNRAVAAIYDGRRAGIAAAFAELRSSWFRCIWVNTLAFLMAWGLIVLVLLAGLTAVLLAARAKTLGQANAVTTVYGAMGLLIFLALPLCLWLTLRYSLAVPACVEEGLGILRSLKRSVFLTRQTKGRILIVLLIVVAAQGTLATALLAPMFPFLMRTRGQPSFAMMVYTLAVSAISSALSKPVYSIGLTLFYYDERIRKEGLDIERALERSMAEVSDEGLASTGSPP
jgi:Membrane domain of glycerophosphoryl diester phosphodiesterase